MVAGVGQRQQYDPQDCAAAMGEGIVFILTLPVLASAVCVRRSVSRAPLALQCVKNKVMTTSGFINANNKEAGSNG